MKNKITFLALFAIATLALFSCSENDDLPQESRPASDFIINYGDYTGAKSSITAFFPEEDSVLNNYFEERNGESIISNIQHAVHFNKNIYFLGNNADEIFWVDDELFNQTENSISTDIVKPRFAVGFGNFLYVSCWGGDIWLDPTTSYLAKVNLDTHIVEEKIPLPGGPEGLAIANDKLYAALNYKDSIAVVDLTSDAVSYIETPTTSSYFVKDRDHNLYVSFVSYDPTATKGLGFIDTDQDVLEEIYELPTISSSYVNIMAPNADFSKIYVVEAGANWGDPGALGVFDVATKSFETSKFQADVVGLNGVAVDNDEIICFISEGVTGNGSAKAYNADGTFIKEYETGIAPFMLLNVE